MIRFIQMKWMTIILPSGVVCIGTNLPFAAIADVDNLPQESREEWTP